MDMVKVTVLRSVPVSDDGIRLRELLKGTDDVVRSDQFEGLRAEGYLVAAGEDPPASEPVTIPADWQELHHATKKKLARSISGDEPADLAAAEAIIEAYLAEQAPKS